MFELLPEKMQQDIKKGKATPVMDYLFTVNKEDPELLDEKDQVWFIVVQHNYCFWEREQDQIYKQW